MQALDADFDLGGSMVEDDTEEAGDTNNSPFPAPVEGDENPECKQN